MTMIFVFIDMQRYGERVRRPSPEFLEPIETQSMLKKRKEVSTIVKVSKFRLRSRGAKIHYDSTVVDGSSTPHFIPSLLTFISSVG